MKLKLIFLASNVYLILPFHYSAFVIDYVEQQGNVLKCNGISLCATKNDTAFLVVG